MIRVIQDGNIFNTTLPVLVNPVNCVGVMGKGLALQFRHRYPDVYDQYRQDCRAGRLRPGTIRAYLSCQKRVVVCLPTKRHWRDDSRLTDIAAGLDALADWTREHPIPGIAIPPLGAGLGRLDWQDVRPHVVRYADQFPEMTTEIYEPHPPRRAHTSPLLS